MEARKDYLACLNSIKEAKDILTNENDADMKEMAREELQENETLQPQIEEKIKMLLVPKDPEDAKNVQMEIRAGAAQCAVFGDGAFLDVDACAVGCDRDFRCGDGDCFYRRILFRAVLGAGPTALCPASLVLSFCSDSGTDGFFRGAARRKAAAIAQTFQNFWTFALRAQYATF
jgi:hypothetical protein